MKTLAISEVRSRLPALVEEVAATREPVVITRHGEPKARLTPVEPMTSAAYKDRYPLRSLPIRISDDFDEPMPGPWEALEG